MDNKKSNISFLLIFIIFLTSFSLGFLTSIKLDYNAVFQNSKEENTSIVDKIWNSLLKKDLDIEMFWQVYNIVSLNYYSNDTMDKKELQYWIINWFVNSLWDKFSEFFKPEEAKQFTDTISWDFEWIWAVVDKNELWIVVDRVLKWSPALNWWVLKWDIIISANDKELKDLSVTDAVSFIKWKAWTVVKLKILRSWEKDFIYKDITRDKIKIPSVDTKDLKDEEIWYISLNIFWEDTSKEFKELLDTFTNDKTKWIIIDLRDNWWGLLQSAVEILSNFIPNGKTLVTTKYKNSQANEVYPSENTWKIFDKKIVILINWNTASASEITAWALRDYNKAILVWEKSYWKWSVQQPFSLPDGSMLKLTIAKWYTPNDVSIDHNWIKPDVEVSFKKEDYTPETWKEKDFVPYDRQLETAKQVLKDFIKLDNISLVLNKYNPEKTSTWTTTSSWNTNTSTWKVN